MNKIVSADKVCFKGCIGDLLHNFKSETAFVGKCGEGKDDSVYLISHKQVISLIEPQYRWDILTCPVTVKYFVDLEIIVKKK